MMERYQRKFINVIQEMAIPRNVDRQRLYYHGTSISKAGQTILTEGIKPKDIVVKRGKRPMMEPKPGMVYLTQNLEFALTYLIGFLFGEDMEDYLKKLITKDGQFGYLFEINGNELQDIYPDEDQIGELLDSCLNNKNDRFPWLINMASRYLTTNTIKRIKYHDYPYYSQAGKKLMDYMTDEQIHQILDEYSNVAHRGTIKPNRAWKFDKFLYSHIKDDARKFFEYAENIL